MTLRVSACASEPGHRSPHEDGARGPLEPDELDTIPAPHPGARVCGYIPCGSVAERGMTRCTRHLEDADTQVRPWPRAPKTTSEIAMNRDHAHVCTSIAVDELERAVELLDIDDDTHPLSIALHSAQRALSELKDEINEDAEARGYP